MSPHMRKPMEMIFVDWMEIET